MSDKRGPTARAVLVAAGASRRMGAGELRKPWLDLGGRPVLAVAAGAVSAPAEVRELVVVAHPEDVARVEALARDDAAFAKLAAVVPGGRERGDSVRLGARASDRAVDVIAVHDAARPGVAPETVARCIRAAWEDGAALVAVPVTDTVKESDDGRTAARTLDRERLWAAQTPQCFRSARFLELLERAHAEGLAPTDDAALWERWEGPVTLVPGSARNRKVTTPEDLELLRALLFPREVRA